MSTRQRAIMRASAAAPSGAGTTQLLKTLGARQAVFHLNATAVSGTNPTLDLVIQWRDPASGNWLTLATFTQVTGAANQTQWVGTGAGTNFLPGEIRASWTVGGTATPTVTFSLGADLV